MHLPRRQKESADVNTTGAVTDPCSFGHRFAGDFLSVWMWRGVLDECTGLHVEQGSHDKQKESPPDGNHRAACGALRWAWMDHQHRASVPVKGSRGRVSRVG